MLDALELVPTITYMTVHEADDLKARLLTGKRILDLQDKLVAARSRCASDARLADRLAQPPRKFCSAGVLKLQPAGSGAPS